MPVYALGDLEPTIHPDAYVHPDAVVIGNVTIGAQASVWPTAVLRGDDGRIEVGPRTSVQDGSIIHCTAHEPTIIGAEVTVGHNVHIEGAVIGDRVYRSAITVFAVCVPLLLGLIALEVGRAAWPAVRRFGPAFLTSDTWDPVAGVFGAGPAIFGTILTSIIALVIATPLALGAAIFLA